MGRQTVTLMLHGTCHRAAQTTHCYNAVVFAPYICTFVDVQNSMTACCQEAISRLFCARVQVFVATRSFSRGDPNRILIGMDSWGNTCGSRNRLPVDRAALSGRDMTELG